MELNHYIMSVDLLKSSIWILIQHPITFFCSESILISPFLATLFRVASCIAFVCFPLSILDTFRKWFVLFFNAIQLRTWIILLLLLLLFEESKKCCFMSVSFIFEDHSNLKHLHWHLFPLSCIWLVFYFLIHCRLIDQQHPLTANRFGSWRKIIQIFITPLECDKVAKRKIERGQKRIHKLNWNFSSSVNGCTIVNSQYNRSSTA